jgi:TRAP-type uncharacterized transport system substrate-binding protein
MLGFNRWHLFTGLVAIFCIVGMSWLALDYLVPAPPSKFIIATGTINQTNDTVGQRYQEILARSGVKVERRFTNGSSDNLKLLNDPASGIQVGIVQGGVGSGNQSPDLLSLGRIAYQYFWIFYRATETLDDPRQLKGQRIALGLEGSGSRVVAEKLLGISGVTSENTTLLAFGSQSAVEALNNGKIDALIAVIAPDSPMLSSLLNNPNVRVMNLARAEALTRIFPFLVRLVLPQGAFDFEKNLPATDVTIVATTLNVLVRKEIHPALIDLLARTILEAHSTPGLFQKASDFPTLTDPEYPVAQNAIDFYKNGPTFLNRYLPFWMTTYVTRLLALLTTVVAIAIPVFSLAPKTYRGLVSFRLNQMYRRLRAIDASLHNEIATTDISLLETELASIDRSIHLLGVPMLHSDLFFNIQTHLDLVRVNLGLRRDRMKGQMVKAA